MERKEFLKIAGLTTLSIPMMSALNKLENITDSFDSSKRMPVLFLGHGSPMNGIEDNEFVRAFKKQGQQLEMPNAIIVVSAHWETNGTFVTAMQNPRTIHDFGGFPKELYEVQYPAPGHPKLAKEISEFINPAGTVHLDDKWGLDHGAWTVVKHLFPKADVPVGSGNMVHNLRKVDFSKINENFGYDWAIEADSKMKKWILEGNHQNLIDFKKQGEAFNLAIPTPEHYLPLLYTLGLKDEKDNTTIFNDNPLGGSLTMTSVKFG